MLKIPLLLACSAIVAHSAYQWSSVQVRGGGYVPGITFHPTTGTAYARTDVGGAYRLEGSEWKPINDMFQSGNDMGSMAIAVDPADENWVYSTGGLYPELAWCSEASFLKSPDKGVTWTRVGLNNTTVTGTASAKLTTGGALCLGGNWTGRGTGNRIAVKGTLIYLGTYQNGLLKSTDRGNSWTTVSQFSNTDGISAVLFDNAGNIFVAPYAGGIYKSANGSTWSKVSGLESVVYAMSYSPKDNQIWLTSNSSNSLDQNNVGGGAVHKLNASTAVLSQVTMPAKGGKDYGYLGVSVDPNDANHVVVATGGWWRGKDNPTMPSTYVPHEAIFRTTNGGSSWVDILGTGTMDVSNAYYAATSIPHWLSALAIDPLDPDHILFGTGYGVVETKNASAAKATWAFASTGIEETVPMDLASTTYGAPLVSVMGDVDGFYHADLNTPPSARHKMEDGVSEVGTNYDLDWAGKVHSYLVRVHKNISLKLGAYSIDGGKTWKNFKTSPPSDGTTTSGENNFIAVSADAKSIVWNMTTHGVYYSQDSGKTWAASTIAASSVSGARVVADRVTAGTYYIYNPGNGSLYKSTNHGKDWTTVRTDLVKVDSWAHGMMRLFASPDQAGELWLTQGANIYTCASGCSWSENYQGGLWIGTGKIHRSVNGGTTFTALPGMLMGRSIGFGKGTGNTSAVYAIGIGEDGREGVWRTEDNGSTWTYISDPLKKFGSAELVIGDPCVYSRVYMTGSARGVIWGQDGSQTNSCGSRIDAGSVPVSYHKTQANSGANITVIGNVVYSNQPIQIFDLEGKLWVVTEKSQELYTLRLSGLRKGTYVARSGNESVVVPVE